LAGVRLGCDPTGTEKICARAMMDYVRILYMASVQLFLLKKVSCIQSQALRI